MGEEAVPTSSFHEARIEEERLRGYPDEREEVEENPDADSDFVKSSGDGVK